MSKQVYEHKAANPSERHGHHDAKTDDAATAKTLLADTQGRWLGGGDKNAAVDKLVKDGVLAEGSTIIDFGKVSSSLKSDKEALQQANATPAIDTKHAAADLKGAQTDQTAAQQKLDAAQKRVDVYQQRIDARTNGDKQVQTDFNTITKATGKDSVYKTDLEKLSKDNSQPKEIQDAAARLLGTYKPGAKSTISSPYAGQSFFGDYIDQKSIDQGKGIHDSFTKNDQKNMAPEVVARDAAKVQKDAADKNVDQKGTALKTVTDQAAQQAKDKATLTQRIDDEQQALNPNSDLNKNGKVVSGGGYYQVAENLLGIGKKGPTSEQAKELGLLTKLLMEDAKALHGGKLPKSLATNDVLLQPENIEKVFERLNDIANPTKKS